MAETTYKQIKFTDEDIINPDDWDFYDKTYLFHDHGVILGIAFASHENNAFDELADSGKIEDWKIREEEINNGTFKDKIKL